MTTILTGPGVRDWDPPETKDDYARKAGLLK